MVRSRRAFSVNPLVVALTILFVAAGVYFLIQAYPYIKARGSAYTVGYLAGNTIVPLVLVALVGIGAYFLTGKNDRVANTGMALTLLLALAWRGWAIYKVHTLPPPPISLSERMKLQNEAQMQSLQRQGERLQQTLEQTRRPPPPATFQPPAITQSPPVAHIPIQTNSPTPPQPATTPTNTASAELYSTLTKELDAQIETFASKAEEMRALVSKPPRASKKDIEDRLTALADFRTQAATLKSALDGAAELAAARAKIANLSAHDAAATSVKLQSEYRASFRSFAIDDLKRLADDASEEATLLRENPNKWRNNGTHITTDDRSLKSRHDSIRFRLDNALSRLPQSIDRLRGR